jgi:phage gp36-like protein
VPYVTQSDYETRYGTAELAALCDRERAGVPDDAVWEQSEQRMASTVDGYLRSRYADALPLTPPLDPALHGAALALMRYWLHADHRPEEVQLDFEAAMTLLKDLQAGRYRLALPLPDAGAAPGGIAYTSRTPAFTSWQGGWHD